jgi:hypothetical protein
VALIDKIYAYKGAGTLLERVASGCLTAAGDIRNEDAGTANHANRMLWAVNVEKDAMSAARRMIARVLGNATIGAAPEACSDNDVQFVVNSLIDAFATGD